MFHVVDDDIIILELLKEIIVSADYDVLCFESGEHYLNHLNSAEYQNPIAVLSDVNMPGITGHAMALQVRHQHPRQKIVFITGKPDVTHHRFSTKLQCYTMDKPFHPERLIALLKVLSACEQSCSAQAASDDNTSSESSSYHHQCELAIEFGCPFHQTPNNT